MQMGYSQEQSVYDSYVGTWKWVDEKTDSEFMIILKKSKADWTKYNAGTADCVVGVYKYKKEGVVIADNLDQISEHKEYNLFPVRLFPGRNHTRLSVTDFIVKNKYGHNKDMGGSSNVKLIQNTEGSSQMQWTIVDDDSGHVYMDSNKAFPKGTSLPTNIVLTKVE